MKTNNQIEKRKPSTAQHSKTEKKNNWIKNWTSTDWTTFRFQFAAAGFLIFWAILWFRAFYIQLIIGPDLAEKASKQHEYTELVEARRGSIYDRNGQVLARSVEARSIYANPRVMEDVRGTSEKLAKILQLDELKLREMLMKDKSFVWIARKVDDATAKAVQMAALPGIGLSREFDRVYPYKHLAGQLLGFVGLDNRGLEGLERSFDDRLAGQASERVIQKDGRGRRYYIDGKSAPQGEDIHLTIDGQVQYIAEEVIAESVINVQAKWGGVLILDVESGDVIAWAQYPFFNPNTFRDSSPEIYRNRIAADALEPGSTLKPFLVAAALEENVVTPETVYFCENGVWETKYITIRDDGRVDGDLTVREIIMKSSNIGVAKIGLDLGIKSYQSYLSRLGFGQRTNVGVGESKGILRPPKEWSEVDLMSASFGQSISATGIQMGQAFLTLANGGVFKPVRLVKEADGEVSTTGAEQRIFSEKTTSQVMQMLEDVVDGEGTGKRARINGLRVAGKTGTAQKAAKNNVIGYGVDRFASFAGIVPADNPRYVIIIMLDEPQTVQYGGRIAAPVFQEVASRALAYGGYLPDVVFAQSNSQNSPVNKNQIKPASSKNTPAIPKLDANAPKILPELVGMSVRKALELLVPYGIVPEIRGTGVTVQFQYPAPKTPIPMLDAQGRPLPCVLWLSTEQNQTIGN